MPPSPDDKLFEDALHDFSHGIHSDLPLRHFGEFHDPTKLKDVVEPRKKSVLAKVFDKIWTREKEEIVALLKNLNRRMDNQVIAEWAKKNQEHEIQSISFLQKWVDMLCEDFNEALESHLRLNPDMEMESLKNYIQSRKLFVVSCFNGIWKPDNVKIQEERKLKLEKHLKSKEEEMLGKLQLQLERKLVKEAKGLLGEVTRIVLERSRQLKSYVDNHHGRVSIDVLKGIVEDIREYLLNGKGSSLKESHEEIYIMLLETLEDTIKFLAEETKKNMTAEEVVKYAERFDETLRANVGATDNAQELQQDMNESGRDANEQSQRWVFMQDILHEIKEDGEDEDSGNQEDGVHVDVDDDMDFDDKNSENDFNRDDGASSAAVNKRRRRRSSHSLDPAISGDDDDANSNDILPSEKPRNEYDVARQSTRTTEKNVSQSKKKVSQEGDRSMKIACDDEDNDDIQAQNGNVQEAKASPEQPIATRNRTRKRKQDERNSKNRIKITRTGSPARRQSARLKKVACNAAQASRRKRSLRGIRKKISKDDKDHPYSSRDDFQNTNKRTNSSRNRASDRKRDQGHVEDSDSPSKPKNRRDDVSITIRNAEDTDLIRRSAVKRRKVLVKKKETKDDDDDFQIEDEKETDDEEVGPVQAISRKKWKGDRIGEPACPDKITVLRVKDRPTYQCNVCKNKFGIAKRSYLLKYHGEFCNEENRPFHCNVCGKGFYQRLHVLSHMRTDTGEKPYQCTKCPLTFTLAGNLKYHLDSHDRGTSYVCKPCDMSFVSSQALHKHNLTHKEKLPFGCNYCNLRFPKLSLLRNHVVVHSGERPFGCPTCEFSSAFKIRLVQHLDRVHRQTRKVGHKLGNDAGIEYLIRETNVQSYRNMPDVQVNSIVVDREPVMLFSDVQVNERKTKEEKVRFLTQLESLMTMMMKTRRLCYSDSRNH